MNPKRRWAIAGVITLSLLAAACGSDSEGSSATEAPTATTEATAETTEAGAETTAAPDATEAPTETEAPAESAAPAESDVDFSALSGSIVGSGATFPKGFYDEAIAELAGIAPDLVIEYGGGGSGKGRSDLQEQVVDFAGTDSTVKEEDMALFKGEFVYVPTVIVPLMAIVAAIP